MSILTLTDIAQPLPRTLYEAADTLDALVRREEINSPVRARVLDIGEQLREIARQQMRRGLPY
jgi:hypothetical protein